MRPFESSFNPHRKYVFVVDNLLCTQCGHMKQKYETLIEENEKHEKFFRSKFYGKRKHRAPGPHYHFRKNKVTSVARKVSY